MALRPGGSPRCTCWCPWCSGNRTRRLVWKVWCPRQCLRIFWGQAGVSVFQWRKWGCPRWQWPASFPCYCQPTAEHTGKTVPSISRRCHRLFATCWWKTQTRSCCFWKGRLSAWWRLYYIPSSSGLQWSATRTPPCHCMSLRRSIISELTPMTNGLGFWLLWMSVEVNCALSFGDLLSITMSSRAELLIIGLLNGRVLFADFELEFVLIWTLGAALQIFKTIHPSNQINK